MIAFHFLLIIIFLLPFPCVLCDGGAKETFLLPERTLPIKGFFTALVLLSHFSSYIIVSDTIFDRVYLAINALIGQLMVAPFFFYSGYGIWEQRKVKGANYMKMFPSKRLLFTWLEFDFMVVLFIMMNIVLEKRICVSEILLAFTGWVSIGNSNWFMFDTFALYILFIISFYLPGRKKQSFGSRKSHLILFTVQSVLYVCILRFIKDSWWWDTVLCFTFGMWFSECKEGFVCKLNKSRALYITFLLSAVVLFLFTYYLSMKWHYALFVICAPLFCLVIVLITMKVSIRSYLLSIVGKHVFSIYMIQRFWYSLLQRRFHSNYIYFGVSLVLILLSAIAFDHVFQRVKGGSPNENDKKLSKKDCLQTVAEKMHYF